MTYVIAFPCVDIKDRACVEECPVDCIYEGGRMLYIHPDECVDCGACEPVCPVEAISYEDDVPDQWKDYTQENAPVLHRDAARRNRAARLTRWRRQARGAKGRYADDRCVAAPERMNQSEESMSSAPKLQGRRELILQMLRSTRVPLSVASIAGQLGVHPNTVRFHVDVLVDAGRVDRLLGVAAGPGDHRSCIERVDPWTVTVLPTTDC